MKFQLLHHVSSTGSKGSKTTSYVRGVPSNPLLYSMPSVFDDSSFLHVLETSVCTLGMCGVEGVVDQLLRYQTLMLIIHVIKPQCSFHCAPEYAYALNM